jgi:hypothetical protein
VTLRAVWVLLWYIKEGPNKDQTGTKQRPNKDLSFILSLIDLNQIIVWSLFE